LKHFKPQVSSEKIPQNGKISLKDEIGSGIYRESLQLENGREIGFAFTVEEEADYVQVPDKYLKDANSIAGIKIINLEVYEYKPEIFFPREFPAGLRVTFDYVAREIDFGVKKVPFEIEKIWCEGGEVCIRIKVNAKNMLGELLELVFYENQIIKIWKPKDMQAFPIEEINVDNDEIIRISYSERGDHLTEYSMKLGSLQFKDKLIIEINEELNSQTQLTLKKRLFRKIGYDALKELEERIEKETNSGDRLVIIANYDNGATYCGNKRLAVDVPSGARILKSIYIVSLDEKTKMKLSDIIEGRGSPRDIGYVGELKIFGKQDEIAFLIFQKAGASSEEFNQLKDKVEFEWQGTESGGKKADIVMKAKEKIMLGGVPFEKEQIIAIIEVGSTIQVDEVGEFTRQFNGAKKDLKKHISLEEYSTVQYGIAVAFGYNPVDTLRDGTYPESIGDYKNPYMEVFPRIEIEEFEGD
ncbi:MAG: hypothetical protein ACUVQY_10940, partial [Thermoproteota archaeon]